MPDQRSCFVFAALLGAIMPGMAFGQRGYQDSRPAPGALSAADARAAAMAEANAASGVYNGGPMGAPGAGAATAMYAQPAMSARMFDPNRKLQPGDELSIRIEQDREPAVPIVVARTGEVIVEPLDHSVKIAGMTVSEATKELQRQLEKDYYYTATVRLVLLTANAPMLGQVYFSGAFARIGAMPLPADRPLKLSDAITSFGGFARFADDRRVKVTRVDASGKETFVVDVKSITKEGHVERDMDVKDGDRIFVGETMFKGGSN